MSKIEWTDETWNPVTGCTKISPGCKNCYAERMAHRLYNMGVYNYRNDFKLTTHDSALNKPLSWKKPRTVFVNSMSDLFHKEVPLKFIQKVFDVMKRASWHNFQVLTKRPDRLVELSDELEWADNIWMGVSVESNNYVYRAEELKKVPAAIKFLSVEPLIGSVSKLDVNGLDWVIVGGESGPGSRVMESEWVFEIRDLCVKNDVPFFFKQWGGVNKKKTGRELEGRTWDELPKTFAS